MLFFFLNLCSVCFLGIILLVFSFLCSIASSTYLLVKFCNLIIGLYRRFTYSRWSFCKNELGMDLIRTKIWVINNKERECNVPSVIVPNDWRQGKILSKPQAEGIIKLKGFWSRWYKDWRALWSWRHIDWRH